MKPLVLGIFGLLGPNGMSGETWSHPDNTSVNYKQLGHWISLARRFEEAKLDFLFFADSYGYPTLDGGVPPVVVRDGGLPRLDPLVLISALAAATENLGFVVTASTTFEPPYANARRFSTLDHLTGGRMGWNIVTGSAMASAAKMFGQPMVPHDQRYDAADDYVDLSLRMWEGGWEDGAVVADKARRVYADAAKVHRLDYDGPFHRAHGVYPVEPSPQRSPVLVQAGSSGRGRDFAARTAELVFLQGTTPETVRRNVEDIRDRAQAQGRRRDAVKIVVGLSLFVAPTPAAAQAKLAELSDYCSIEGAAVRYEANTGINLLRLDPESTLADARGEQGQSNIDRYRGTDGKPAPTVREILDEFRTRALRGLVLTGTPQSAGAAIAAYVEATGIDGFLLEPTWTPGTYDDLFELVLPELRRRGLARTEYAGGTLREELFGPGRRWLADDHPGARVRAGGALLEA